MSKQPAALVPGKEATRPRLPILCAGLAILWVVGWYSWGEGPGLLATAAICVALALGLPRSFANTARSMIWIGILLGVVCLSANLERIVPQEEAIDLLRLYQIDRIVTVAVALALTSLFFAPSAGTTAILVAGCLPMLTYTLAQNPQFQAPLWAALAIWGGLGLFLAVGAAQRATSRRSAGTVPLGGGEWGTRVLAALVALALAYGLAFPVEQSARFVQAWLLDSLHQPLSNLSSARGRWLSLHAPRGGMSGAVRPLLSIRSPAAPGYLRETVFLRYVGGQWRPPSSDGNAANALAEADELVDGWRAYPVFLPGGVGPRETWTVQALAPRRVGSFCLPGTARDLLLADSSSPQADADGVVVPEERYPPTRFAVRVESAAEDAAYPGPDPAGQADYLAIPPALTNAVAKWVADCAGLSEADTPSAAQAAIVRHFHEQFAYALDPLPGGGEPLNVFMAARKGHCTLFASAATLMLRARGIPARMVAGYFCDERHPLTGQWMVRERDGHAWCEAWDARAGRWRLVEATPASGLPLDFGTPGFLRLAMEGLGAAWRAFVESIRALNPLVAVAEAGLWLYLIVRNGLQTPVGWLLLAALLGGGVWIWHRRRQKLQPRDPEAKLRAKLIQAMLRLERKTTSAVLRRRPDEPWTDWGRRVVPQLPSAAASKLERLLAQYQDLRYRPGLDAAAVRRWRDDAHSRKRGCTGG